MRFSVFANYIKFLLNEYQTCILFLSKSHIDFDNAESNGLHIGVIPEMCTC